MDTVLITGGAGFIGSHVTDLLEVAGDQVVVFDNLSSGNLKNVRNSRYVTFVEGDVRNRGTIREVFQMHPDISSVVHLAAQSKVGPSIDNPQEDMNINVLGTLNLLEEARLSGVKKFVYASSAAVYGHVDTLPVTEATETNPLSPYGVSKLAAEEYVKGFGRLYHMDVTALRFANVFGPRQSADTEAGVITIFIERLLNGGQAVIQGDGKQTRDFIYVEDVARAVTAVMREETAGEGAVYNVSSQTSTSIEELLNAICLFAEVPFDPAYTEERPGDIKHSYLSNEKLRAACNWQSETSFEAGIRKTVDYYKEEE